LACLVHHVTGLGVDQVAARLGVLELVPVVGNAPALLRPLIGEGRVVGGEDFFGIHAERLEQRSHRNLAAPVDARIDDVLGVELDIEPGAAIGNDAAGEQQLARGMGLALVVVEEHARRTVHLGDDDALGAVDDEGAIARHEGHVAHVDVLLLDVLDRAGTGFLVDLENDQPQRHLQRRSERHVALPAFVDVVFGLLEFVAHELQGGRVGEIRDRENRLEDGLQPLFLAAALWLVHEEELVIGGLLDLDEIRHLRDFANRPEGFAYLATAIERGSHTRSYLSLECLGGKCPKTRQSAVGPQEICPVELVWSQDRPRFRNFRPARKGDGHRVLERDRVGAAPQRHPDNSSYFSSTLAPAASSFFWMSSASALEAPSLMAFGADSTSALASPRPRPVMARTSLMTLILFSPKEARITSNS